MRNPKLRPASRHFGGPLPSAVMRSSAGEGDAEIFCGGVATQHADGVRGFDVDRDGRGGGVLSVAFHDSLCALRSHEDIARAARGVSKITRGYFPGFARFSLRRTLRAWAIAS